MRILPVIAAVAATLATASVAHAQAGGVISGGPSNGGSTSNFEGPWSSRNSGILATSPSRMERSRREMNRGREQVWRTNMTPTQTKSYAETALERGGFQCTVADAIVVAQLSDGTPIVEVACRGTGGLLIADSEPMQATDCLDLTPEDGMLTADRGRIGSCRLPANVASVATVRR